MNIFVTLVVALSALGIAYIAYKISCVKQLQKLEKFKYNYPVLYLDITYLPSKELMDSLEGLGFRIKFLTPKEFDEINTWTLGKGIN